MSDTGSYGVQRFTNDIDLLIDGAARTTLKKILLQNGYSIFAESHEVIQFNGFIPVDILCANRPFSLAMLENAKIEPLFTFKVVGAEGLIGLKIQAYCNDPKKSLRDKADIAALIAALIEANSNTLDWTLIRTYADLFGEWPTIEGMILP